MDFLNRDDGVAVASAGQYANHLLLAPDRQPHQHLITQVCHGSDALPAAQPTASKHTHSLILQLECSQVLTWTIWQSTDFSLMSFIVDSTVWLSY